VDLQMMRAGVFWRRDESSWFGVERIAHIDDRETVAEHMSDEGVAFMNDDLHAVRPAALIASRNKTDVFGARAGNGSFHGVQTIKLRIRITEARPGVMPNRAPISIGRAYAVLVAGLFVIVITIPTTISATPTQVR
jgi:hypothetical protein